MTIDSIRVQKPTMDERTPLTVQNGVQKEVQKEVLKDTVIGSGSTQKQMLQLLTSAQPMQQVQQTAQSQLSKGYLDIKV